jgi:hypothetical protein
MFRTFAFATVVLVSITAPVAGHAMTLHVNCDQPMTKLSTINAALKLIHGQLEDVGPSTIEVSGACNENISVDGMANLTLTAKNGASITDASGGTLPVIRVQRTTNFFLNGFSIRGGAGPFNAAIYCIWTSTCYLSRNNVQSPGHVAINTAFGSFISLDHDTLEQSLIGLYLHSSRAELLTVTIRNNSYVGVFALENAFAAVAFSSVLDHNFGGLLVSDHSTAEIDDSSMSNNRFSGVTLQSGSEARFATANNAGTTITGNGVNGVVIDDLSFANFEAGNTAIFGNSGQVDVVCQGHFSAVSRNAAFVGTTNCAP